MKGLVPSVTSNVAAAAPIPGHGVSLSPSPPHIKPQLTKAALGGIMRSTAPFNCVWSVCDILSLLVSCVDTLWPASGAHRTIQTAPHSLDTSHSGQHQSPATSSGQQSGPCTHTALPEWKQGSRFSADRPQDVPDCFFVCLEEGLQTKTSTDNFIFPLFIFWNPLAIV